jgi:hypothetical protein
MSKGICDIRPTMIPTHRHVLPRSPIPSSQKINKKDPHQKDPQNYREWLSLLIPFTSVIYILRMKKRDLYSKSQTYPPWEQECGRGLATAPSFANISNVAKENHLE